MSETGLTQPLWQALPADGGFVAAPDGRTDGRNTPRGIVSVAAASALNVRELTHGHRRTRGSNQARFLSPSPPPTSSGQLPTFGEEFLPTGSGCPNPFKATDSGTEGRCPACVDGIWMSRGPGARPAPTQRGVSPSGLTSCFPGQQPRPGDRVVLRDLQSLWSRDPDRHKGRVEEAGVFSTPRQDCPAGAAVHRSRPAGSTQVSMSVQPHVVHGLGSDLAELWWRGQVTPAGLLQSSPELSLSRTAASRKAGPETCLS